MRRLSNEDFLEKSRSIHGDRFEYLDPYTKMREPIRMRCKIHDHVFLVTPFGHLYEKTGCPICGKESRKKKKRIPPQEVVARAEQVHGAGRYDYSQVGDFSSVSDIISIVCHQKDEDGNEHGVFRQSWANHIYNKQGCPCCSGVAPLSTETFIAKAQKIHGGEFDYSLVEYKNNRTNVEIVCNTCGYHFFQTPTSHLNGSRCPQCLRKQNGERCRLTREEFIRRAREVHGDKFDYSKVDYKNSWTKVCIICSIHGEFWQRPADHLRGQGCPICRGRETPKLIYGVGINDTYGSDMNIQIYGVWIKMLQRCYDEKSRYKHPTYKGCSVCEEWLLFSNYQKWYKENHHKDFVVDKDLLIKGNKIYSPDNCCFVPRKLNNIILRSQKTRGKHPMGVFKSKSGMFGIRISKQVSGVVKNKVVIRFSTPEEAFYAYKEAKESYIKEVAQEYYDRGEITKKVYDALMKYEIDITD